MPVEQGMPPSGPLDRSKVHEDDTETWAKIDAVITDNVSTSNELCHGTCY